MPEREQLITQVNSRLEWAREKLKELERATSNGDESHPSPRAKAAKRWGLIALIAITSSCLWLLNRSTRQVIAAGGIFTTMGAVIAAVLLLPDGPRGQQDGMPGQPDVTLPSPSSPTTIPPGTTTVPSMPPGTSTPTALPGDGSPFTAPATRPAVTPGPEPPPSTTTQPPTTEPPPPDDDPDEAPPDEANPSCLLQLDLELAGLGLEVCV